MVSVPGLRVVADGVLVHDPRLAKLLAEELHPAIALAFHPDSAEPLKGQLLMAVGEALMAWARGLSRPLAPVAAEAEVPETWPTTVQVAHRLQVTRQQVGNLLAAGRLDGRKGDRGHWRIDPESLENEMQRREQAA